MASVSVILPIFNEKENIVPLLAEIEAALANNFFEVIAVDDGSNDGSRELLRHLAQTKDYLNVIFFRKNQGQTAAFDAGFRAAQNDIIVTMDADRQNDPADIIPMIRMLDGGYDFVSGWRKERQDAFMLRKIPSKIANWIIRSVTKTKLHDMGCSLKVYRKAIADDLKLYGEMHRFISVIAEDVGARVGEHVVNHRPRVAGSSKYGLGRTFKVLFDLLTVWFFRRYKTKPLHFFGAIGSLLILAGSFLASFVFFEKIFVGVAVHRNPLFIIAMVAAIVGFQFFALGLLAELVMRTYFESQSKPTYYIESTIQRKVKS